MKHPGNARSLFGLEQTLITRGRDADAEWVKRAFDKAWADADTMLTIEGL